MILEGDGHDGQPTDGEVSLDDIADAMLGKSDAPGESDDSEESDEAEEVEADEESEESDEDEAEEEPTFTIKVQGKDVTLTKSEMIEMAQKGQDYTAKTMAVAEDREAVKAERTKATEYRQQQEQAAQEASERLQALATYLQSQLGEPPGIELLHTQGSDVYLAHKEQYEHRRAQLQHAFQAQQNAQQDAQLKRQARIAEQAEATEKALRDTLPGWNDETLNTLAGYGRDFGLTPDIAGEAFVSKGFWEVLHKAKAYDAIQAQKAQMKPKAQLAKVDKPVAKNQTGKVAERAKREAAFNKNPSADTLAEFFR
jgi:chemotaxis protein histidine kinase CheA